VIVLFTNISDVAQIHKLVLLTHSAQKADITDTVHLTRVANEAIVIQAYA